MVEEGIAFSSRSTKEWGSGVGGNHYIVLRYGARLLTFFSRVGGNLLVYEAVTVEECDSRGEAKDRG
jgi:hypothetical protein